MPPDVLLRLATGIPIGIIATWVLAFPRAGSPEGWVQFVIMAAIFLRAQYELLRLIGATERTPATWITYLGGLTLMLLMHLAAWPLMPVWGFGFLALLLLTQLRPYDPDKPFLQRPALYLAATFYLAFGLGAVFLLRDLSESWATRGLLAATPYSLGGLVSMLGTWGYDSCALFAGSLTGKIPMAPHISPGKSMEGLVGGLVGVMAIFVIAARLLVPTPLPLPALMALGIACGLASQTGDLIESALKRQANLKDSAALIPSQGGFLDKLDGFIWVAPTAYLVLLMMWGT